MPQVAITAIHLQRTHVKSPAFSIVLALQCLLLFAKIQYYSRYGEISPLIWQPD
jgi:hypothetical protein